MEIVIHSGSIVCEIHWRNEFWNPWAKRIIAPHYTAVPQFPLQIEGTDIFTEQDFLGKVTYIPSYAHGNAGHKDCKQGVIMEVRDKFVMVLYCESRTVQATSPQSLVWG